MPIFATAMSACSMLPLVNDTPSSTNRLCAHEDGTFYSCHDTIQSNKMAEIIDEETPHASLFSTDIQFNTLSDYTGQMAAELQKHVQGMQVGKPIVVASFVNLDSTLRNTNALGIQLAESFIDELQQIGLPVNDHKLNHVLDINEKGDFAFSRERTQYFSEVDMGYVLTGTMTKNSRGLIVNARIVNAINNKVLASTSKFLPNAIINNLM